MQHVLLIIILVIFALYFLLILYYRQGWLSIPDYKFTPRSFREGGPQTRISIIIPARNEEGNISACLDSVCRQSYPKQLYEVLVVDDHSTDNTPDIIKNYAAQNVKLISLKDFVGVTELNAYKKKAIEVAIGQSGAELIITTDADCVAPENWIRTIAAFYEAHQPQFIAAPVAFRPAPPTGGAGPWVRFIKIFQALDFMTLQGITGASVHKKIHSMCNGANLAYTKKAFEEAGGFSGIDTIASGDDMLLMHKIYRHYPDKVMFLKSKEVIMQTEPVKTTGEFFSQRIRWASKAATYDDKRIFWVLLLVYLFNLLLLILPLISLFAKDPFELKLYPFTFILTFFELWLFLLVTKTVIELIFLYPIATFFTNRRLLWLFPLMQPFHIIYTVMAGGLGSFGSYTWKERRVK